MESRRPATFAITGTLVLVLLTACAGTPNSAPVVNTAVAAPGAMLPEIIVYASDLPSDALSELDFIDDAASPEGKSIGLPNNGDELDAPPENDPHAIFTVSVQNNDTYRSWINMKVGATKGESQANVIW